MDYVRLAPGLPPSSRLGFGCGSIMGRVGRAESLRAIGAALDAGITHFDTARLYGYGEAENLLGEAVRGRRDQIVIASKFGLVATRAAMALRGLKPLAQKLVGNIPGLRPLIRGLVGTAQQSSGAFTPEAAERSLAESLRALQTDYLDILFLHDPGAADLTGELEDFLKAQVAAGRIRAYGIASDIDTVAALYPTHRADMIWQFANSVTVRAVERLPPNPRRLITHNPFTGAAQIAAARDANPDLFRLADGRPIAGADIYPLMLSYALSVAGVDVVLCSMLGLDHLRDNVATMDRPRFGREDIAAFVQRAGV
jgi:aryl-alcohol dehydrogenase-like predicted oxidoreductase